MLQVKKINEGKMLVGPCRLSYAYLLEPKKFDGDAESKYSTHILIPKNEKEAVAKIQKAIDEAIEEGKASKWKGKVPGDCKSPLFDGDLRDDEAYKGMWYVNAKSKNRPGVVNRKNEPLTDEDQVYSGMYAYVTFKFYAYDKGGKGVGTILNNVLKAYDGDRLGGGGSSTASDFDGFLEEDDEDL